MSAPLPNLGLIGEFSICDKDIIAGLNTNFELLDNLVQLSVIDIVGVLPGGAAEGDKYILSTDKSINLWNGTAWVSFPAQEGFVGYNKADGLIYFYDGTNWIVQFNAIAVFYDNTVSGLVAGNVQAAIDEVVSNFNADISTIEADIVTIESDIAILEDKVGPSVVVTTSAYSILANDQIIICQSTDHTVTFPTAVGVTGKRYTICHDDTSLARVYTINTTSGQTVGGLASGAYQLNTNGERLTVVSNGTNWIILEHYAQTGWINNGAINISGTTTAPTKASSLVIDELFWRRDGIDMLINMRYRQNATAGAAAGSGGYIFGIPTNAIIDTAFTGTVTGGTIPDLDRCIGSAVVGNNTVKRPSCPAVFNTNRFVIFAYTVGSGSYERVGSTFFQTTDATGMTYVADIRIPILGWRP